MFFDNYVRICEHFGEAQTMVLREIGVSASAYQNWKAGGNPSNATKKKLAQHFGITIDELMTGQIKNPAAESGNEVDNQLDADIIKLFAKLSLENKALALALLKGLAGDQ